GGIRFIEGNLEDISGLATALDIADPDVVFHLGAQSYVPRSFTHPVETAQINSIGTNNLLEAIRKKDCDPTIVFAGSSEEYGLVFSSKEQYARTEEKYGAIFPQPTVLPEVPIKETNPLRPMSPYAVSKVYGDHLMRNYFYTYGTKAIVSRAFNHEGAGRGIMFVTSVVTNQVAKLVAGEIDQVTIGNVNAFRDWSHVRDVINGYCLLAGKGKPGEVYNQGSMRTTSVLSYILLSLEAAGMPVDRIETFGGEKSVDNPTGEDTAEMFGVRFDKTHVDRMLLEGSIDYTLADRGITAVCGGRKVRISFDGARFRPAEVPILMADITKLRKLGFASTYSVGDIVRDQLNYFMDEKKRA
ncbi:MAG: GDP-mannose 4,6-dehydratase, partial [Methanofollis sp.]|uniref:GDP-mannose 4,6-dehydratase n=1 Tax=Methanofollis sp. TaxID=2052835 RepID=UPI002634CCF2